MTNDNAHHEQSRLDYIREMAMQKPRIKSSPTHPPYLKREHCTVNGESRDIYDYDNEEYGRHLQHMEESLFHRGRVIEEITTEDKDGEKDEIE